MLNMIKRRRQTLNTLITWGLVFFICVALFKSVRKRRGRIYDLPETTCSQSALPKRNTHPTLSVLLWTPFNGDSEWIEVRNANEGYTVEVEGGNCVLTTDKTSISKADAVIFHSRDIDFDNSPTYRCPWQQWIFFSLDGPISSGLDPVQWQYANQLNFNLTMTYSTHANITYNLGQVIADDEVSFDDRLEREIADKIEDFIASFFERKKEAVWVVNNKKCTTPGAREQLVKTLLDKGIKVDIVGEKCIDHPLSDHFIESVDLSNYRFYLALEDAYCDDLVGETYKALKFNYKYGLIPVVYSGANLKEFLPMDAYIDASNSSRIHETVDWIKKLSSDDGMSMQQELAKFYGWQRSSRLAEENYHQLGLKSMCETLLSIPPLYNKYYSLSNDLRTNLGKCYHPGSHIVQSFFF